MVTVAACIGSRGHKIIGSFAGFLLDFWINIFVSSSVDLLIVLLLHILLIDFDCIVPGPCGSSCLRNETREVV
jgi:hypothetical protein